MTFEFRNIGKVGRNMSNAVDNYTYNEMINLLSKKFVFDKERVYIDDEYSRVYKVDKFIIRINDWGIFENGMHIKANKLRGRLTEGWKISSFFEHIKHNEWNY